MLFVEPNSIIDGSFSIILSEIKNSILPAIPVLLDIPSSTNKEIVLIVWGCISKLISVIKGLFGIPISITLPWLNNGWLGIPELSNVSTIHWDDMSNILIVYIVVATALRYPLSIIWIKPFSFNWIGFCKFHTNSLFLDKLIVEEKVLTVPLFPPPPDISIVGAVV